MSNVNEIRKLSQLFSTVGTEKRPAPPVEKAGAEQAQALAANPDAVKVATSMAEPTNPDKLAAIKAKVQSNTYNPDPQEVAKALMRDLFA